MKFLKVGRVAIITHGRYAGKKVRKLPPIHSYPTNTASKKEWGFLAKVRNGQRQSTTTSRRRDSSGGIRIAAETRKRSQYLKRRSTSNASVPCQIAKKENNSQCRARANPTDPHTDQEKIFATEADFAPQVVIIQPVDSGNKAHPFGHALVAGIERYPSKITRRMSKARQDKRSKVKPFVKLINYNHLMPTRYTLELEGLKGTVSNDTFKEPTQREEAKKTVKKVLEERYTSGKNRWFFTPLSTYHRLRISRDRASLVPVC